MITQSTFSTVERDQSTQQNFSCSLTAAMPHSTTSATPTQVTSATSGDKSTDNYTMLDPVYDTVDSDIDGRNQVLLSEKYEFVDSQYYNIVESSSDVPTEKSVFSGQETEDQDCAYEYLQ